MVIYNITILQLLKITLLYHSIYSTVLIYLNCFSDHSCLKYQTQPCLLRLVLYWWQAVSIDSCCRTDGWGKTAIFLLCAKMHVNRLWLPNDKCDWCRLPGQIIPCCITLTCSSHVCHVCTAVYCTHSSGCVLVFAWQPYTVNPDWLFSLHVVSGSGI